VRATVNVLLGWFAFYNLTTGAWQSVAPRSFYDDFPGLGRHWVGVDGPYNEHLVRDYGQGNVAIGVAALVAVLTGGVWLARATGLAAVLANLPHQAYHQAHLHLLPTSSDQVLQTVALSVVSLTSVLLAVLAFAPPVGRTEPVSPEQHTTDARPRGGEVAS
jgi:hypothetical protein